MMQRLVPEAPIWINTTGATLGWIWSRWQEVDGVLGPEFASRVERVKRTDLRARLPRETPVLTPQERRASLVRRAELLRDRFARAYPARPEILRRLHAAELILGQKISGQCLDQKVID